MAEKGFGVKEINLIGASGTPTIESPNNLNLNAVNVAISTNATIGGNLTVSGTVGIAGTLTYEDVTNVDSIGILTARTGVKVLAGGINVVGVSYFNNNIVATATTALSVTAADESSDTSCNVLFSTAATGNVAPKTGSNLTFNSSNGTLSATTFSGSGASLTSLPAANLTGTLPAISGANLTGIAVTEAPVTDYTITADSGSNYYFHGGGVDETDGNPDLYLIRGQKYRFNNTTGSGHPFAIRESNGGSAYTDGVSGSQTGIQFFTVPYDAPAKIFYQCTIHGGMVGNIYIRGAGGQNTNVGITTSNSRIHFTNESVGAQIRVGGQDDFQVEHDGSHTYLANNTGDLVFQNDANIKFTYKTGGAEKLRIDSSGRILQGSSTGRTTALMANQTQNQIEGVGSNASSFSIFCNSTGTAAGAIIFAKSKGNSLGSTTVVQENDSLGHIAFEGLDGTQNRVGARITAAVDGAVSGGGAADMPGRLMFFTTDDGTGTETERLRIDKKGRLTLNNSEGIKLSAVASTLYAENGSLSYYGTNNGVYLNGAGTAGFLRLNASSDNFRTCIDIYGETNTTMADGISFRNANNHTLRLYSNGNIGAPSGNNIYNASDERLKENMVELTDGLSKINQIKPYSFTWKSGFDKDLNGVTQYGFGAHQTKSVDEILVEPFGEGDVELDGETIENPLRVNEKHIIPLLVKAIQELSTKNNELEAKVAALEGS